MMPVVVSEQNVFSTYIFRKNAGRETPRLSSKEEM